MSQAARRTRPNDNSGLEWTKATSCISRSPVELSHSDAEFTDQRKHPRNTTHDLSEIILDGRTYGLACLIRDMSETGARLEVSCGSLPKRFILANYTKRTKTLCRQVWRDNRLVGVSFLTSPREFSIDEGF